MTSTPSSPSGLDRRVAKLAEQVAELGTDRHELPICIMGPEGIADDPRMPALLAVARAEGRMLVRPWSETPDGRLVDWSSMAECHARMARADAAVIDERDLHLHQPPATEQD